MTGGRGQSRGCITLGWCGGGVQLWGLLAHTQMGGTVAADRLSRQRGQNQPGAGVCVCVHPPGTGGGERGLGLRRGVLQ